MKQFIKIKTSRWIEPGRKMLYEDECGKTFVGPSIQYINGETIIVEAGERQIDGSYPIVRILGRVTNKD